MKKIVLLALSLCLVVVGCSKPSSEVEPIASRETVGSETVNEATIDAVEEKTVEQPKTELQIKAEEYEAYLQAEYQKFEEQVKHFRFNTPASVTPENIKNSEIESRYYYDENKKIKAYDFEYDERNCTCKYKIISTKGQELEYKASFKKDPLREEIENGQYLHPNAYYDFDPDRYYLLDIELLSEINPKQLVYDEVMSVWSVVNMEYDENKETIIPILEQYEDENQPFYDKYNDKINNSVVIDYVKANFTGSGYDEYLVIYGQHDESDTSHPERARCILVDNNQVISAYDIPVGSFTYFDLNEDKSFSYNFGYIFSHGIIDDYNNNGLNEIYFYTSSIVDTYSLCFIEYDGEEFKIDFLGDDCLSSLYSNKTICSLDIENSIPIFDGYDYLGEDETKVWFQIYGRMYYTIYYCEEFNEWVVKRVSHNYTQFYF